MAELQAAGRRVWFVWGNTDDRGPTGEQYARSLGLMPPPEVPLRLHLTGKSLAIFHGHEPEFERLLERARANATEAGPGAARPAIDYVLVGHWHRMSDERIGPMRLINPGALQRVRVRSVATLDLASDVVRFWRADSDRLPDGLRLEELPTPERIW